MSYLTETLRIEILMMIGFGDRRRNQTEVARLFNETHPELPHICQGTVSKVEAKYHENGHVRNIPRQRQPIVEDNTKLNVLLAIQENPVTSARQIARENDLSHTTVMKLLHASKMHPYKMQAVQELIGDDTDRRIEFCEQMMNLINDNQISLDWILFSDESTFTLNGEVNRQNCRYWNDSNPHWIEENHTQYPQKVNVWAGIIGNRIIGPAFLNETLNGERYLTFLQEDLIPYLAVQFPNENDPDLPDNRVWFQQDGAPPHYALPVRRYLNEIFPNRWIGRRGAVEWPARSPDLTPLDFFLWGYLKNKVYVTKPTNIEDLKESIRHETSLILPEMLEKVKNEFYNRLGFCQETRGAHFEHLL